MAQPPGEPSTKGPSSNTQFMDMIRQALPVSLKTARQFLQGLLGLVLGVAMVIWGLPWIADVTWAEIGNRFAAIGWGHAARMALLTAIGLYCYTFLLTGSLPGLRHGQAITINLSGTSVSNVLPMGSVVGIACAYMMCRSWGYGKRVTSTHLLLTAIWNFVSRMCLPVLAIMLLFVTNQNVPRRVEQAGLLAVIIGLTIILGTAGVLANEKVAVWVGRILGKISGPFRKRTGKTREQIENITVDLRHRTYSTIRSGGLAMTLGMAGFFGFYFWLWVDCLRAVGVDNMSLIQLFTAYAVGRAVTALPITPGSMGVTETAALAILLAWGAPSAAATAGVLLFSIFVNVLQVTVGMFAWVAWWVGPKPGLESNDDADSKATA